MSQQTVAATREAETTIRVLCVDDDPAFAEQTSEYLGRRDEPFEVATESDPRVALDRLGGEQFDCVVSDYDMPGMNGIEFLERVREAEPGLPFILFTGKGSEEVASKAISEGVSEYLQKQVGGDQYAILANRITTVVGRSRTERELEAMHQRYDLAAKASDDAFFDWDARSDTAAVDAQFRADFGYDAERHGSASDWWTDRIHRDDREEVVGTLQEVFQAGAQEWSDEYRFRLADGSVAHVESRGYVVYEDGEPVRVVGVLRDVTDRVERVLELQTFKEAVENAGHSIYWTDSDGTIEYVNPAFEEVTGYSEGEAVGREPDILKSGFHDDEFYTDLWETISGGEVWKSEIVNERKNGERYTVNQTIAPIETAEGEIEQFVAINADITGRKRRERELERLRKKYEGFIEGAPDPLFVAETETGTVVEVNSAAVAFLGRPRAELVGTDQANLHPSGEAERYRALFERHLEAAEDGPAVFSELDDGSPIFVERADGGRVPVEINASTVDLGDQTLILGSFRDVTDRIERERRLRDQNRRLQSQNERLDGLVSTISHDFRNPLHIADNSARLAAEDCDSNHLETVTSALDRMNEMIADMLSFAEYGQPVTDGEQIDVSALAERCWANVPTADATVRLDGSHTVRADRSRLKHLLENLFRNAVDHGGEEVAVRVGTTDGASGFYVADDGPGIPAAERDRVFDSGYSTAEEGTGFGLAIVEQIANAHGWEITVTESEAGGARFEIRTGDRRQEARDRPGASTEGDLG